MEVLVIVLPDFLTAHDQFCAADQMSNVQQTCPAEEHRTWQHTGGGLAWNLPAGVLIEDCMLLWLGSETAPQLQHLHLTYNRHVVPAGSLAPRMSLVCQFLICLLCGLSQIWHCMTLLLCMPCVMDEGECSR